MDPHRFDRLVRTLTTGGSRRRLLGMLSALPLVGTALANSEEDTTAAKGKRKHHEQRQDPERESQRAGTEATSCAKRCRTKNTKQSRRKCRKRCQTPPECTTGADCPASELCESGVCIPIPDQCEVDTDCDACEACLGGVCIAQCQPDEVCRNGQCESVQCTTDGDCRDCSRCVAGRCRWQCGATEVCLSGAGGRCCQPRSCPAGADCGTVDDGCGGTVRCGPETCSQPDDPCQETVCTANVCTTGPGNNGASCDDGDACTTGSTCAGGLCGAGTTICTDPPVCRTAVEATCSGGTCTYPTEANGTTCGTQSVTGGGAIHCCNGTCPDPDCVPAGTLCAVQDPATCRPTCCTQSLLVNRGQYYCDGSGGAANVPCGSDADCSFSICQCGVCCVASGSPVIGSLGCAGCCSGACNGAVCA